MELAKKLIEKELDLFEQHFKDAVKSRVSLLDRIMQYIVKRKGKQMAFTFGANLNGDEPTAYDILACLTKYDPGTFEDFSSDYGYDEDSRKAESTYKAVCKEWRNVERVFGDCLDELREIQ